jgi:hypothetical protein
MRKQVWDWLLWICIGKTSFIKIIKGDIELDAKATRLIDYFTMKKSGN